MSVLGVAIDFGGGGTGVVFSDAVSGGGTGGALADGGGGGGGASTALALADADAAGAGSVPCAEERADNNATIVTGAIAASA